MTLLELDDLVDETHRVANHVNERRSDRSGHMQLGDLLGISHLENKHSDVIAFLLKPGAEHRHPEYGEAFLSLLRDQGLAIKGTAIEHVVREYGTDERRRIDILIETNIEVIIVENKVYASDLENQVADYLTYVRHQIPGKKPFVVYLTLDGREVPSISLDAGLSSRLTQDGSLLLASYKDQILTWLNRLQTKAQGEEILRAAILQYADMIKGLCGMRQEDIMEKQEIVSHYMQKYEQNSWTDFQAVYQSGQLLKHALDTIYLIKALKALQNRIANRGHDVLYTQGQRRFSDPTQWVSAVSNHGQFIGIEVPLESDGEQEHGLAVEFNVPGPASKLTFGHG